MYTFYTIEVFNYKMKNLKWNVKFHDYQIRISYCLLKVLNYLSFFISFHCFHFFSFNKIRLAFLTICYGTAKSSKIEYTLGIMAGLPAVSNTIAVFIDYEGADYSLSCDPENDLKIDSKDCVL